MPKPAVQCMPKPAFEIIVANKQPLNKHELNKSAHVKRVREPGKAKICPVAQMPNTQSLASWLHVLAVGDPEQRHAAQISKNKISQATESACI